MKTRIALFACLVLLHFFSMAQNLVPNPSFEEYTQCPTNGGQIDYTLYWTTPLIGGGSSPDYFNPCGAPSWRTPANGYGYEPARTGVAYTAIVTATYNPLNPAQNNVREYLQVQLLDSLTPGVEYCISFYVSAGDSMGWVSNNIGVYFSPTKVSDTCIYPCGLTYTPQFENDSTNDLSSRVGWTEVSGRYTASGGEKFIVIGNFRDSVTTVATYVDWSNLGNLNRYANYYIDDVYLVRCDTSINAVTDFSSLDMNIYPNPSNGYYLLDSREQIKKTQVFDSTGRLVLEEDFILQKNASINIRDQPNGIYLISVITLTNTFFFKLLKT